MKKTIRLALAAFSAMLALPALASATLAHVNPPANGFTIHSGTSTLERTSGSILTGKTTTGSGSFENTTTGTVKLTFQGVQSDNPTTNCASVAEGHSIIAGGGTVTTTTLPFHLVMLETNRPGILVTPAANNHFATFKCAGGLISVVEKGNGVLGEITSPECGKAGNTATLKFESSTPGHQRWSNYTGVEYSRESSLNGGAFVKASMNSHATITFNGGATPTLECTH